MNLSPDPRHPAYRAPVQRVIGILVGVLVLFWILRDPTSAASTVSSVLAGLASAADSVIEFLRDLV